MPLPAPRSGEAPVGMDTSTWQVLSTLGELREDIRGIAGRLDRDFVPRTEHDQHAATSERDRALLHAEDVRLDTKIDGAVKSLQERMDGEEKERASAQRWALGLTATILLAVAGEGVTLFTHFH